MFFSKKNRLVGLDIGSRTLKLAEIIDTNTGSTLKNFSTIDMEPGLIEEGSVRDPEAVSGYIRELFKSIKLRDKNVAISIGGYSVIVKKINLPTKTEDEQYETIHFDAEPYIPYDMSEVDLDFQILGESEHNPNQMNVLLVAAKKEMISEYINLMKMAKLHPRLLDVDAFALQNIYQFNYTPVNENIALIDIGASKTSLNILKDNVSEFMRDVSLGCNQINDKIASTIGCTIEETEGIKFGEESDLISAEDVKEIVVSVVTDWCVEIKRALDFFYSTYPQEQISRIVLSGGGANIKKFLELLAAETSAEVEVINPFQNFTVDSNRFDSSYLEQIAPQAAICMGLATRKIGDK